MNRRREPCRNFQRGSCQYGDRCKFLHVTLQQPKPNPFGFGTLDNSRQFHAGQQQKPNPFGFGVQSSSAGKDSFSFGSRSQGQSKPFENKWIRQTNSNPPQQADKQPQAAVHTCTDSESCKRQIVEDFKNEAPNWKLTCYAHWKYLPCDISGDISYEELRAAAYEEARRGINLQSIVDRERNLWNAKLIEFDKLLKNPYVATQNPALSGMNQFPGTNGGVNMFATQSNGPPSFSSFGQLETSSNLGSNISTQAQVAQPSTIFGQPSVPQNVTQSLSGPSLGTGMSGFFGSQLPAQPQGISPSPNAFSFNNGFRPVGSHSVALPSTPPQFPTSTNNQLPSFFSGPKSDANLVHQSSVVDEAKVDSGDNSIWLKEKWKMGEIPEEEPPQRFC